MPRHKMHSQFVAHIVQDGEGCDYTIACGEKMLNLSARTLDGALAELKTIIMGRYANDLLIGEATIFEVASSASAPVSDWYNELAHAGEIDEEIHARAEYERLKARFED